MDSLTGDLISKRLQKYVNNSIYAKSKILNRFGLLYNCKMSVNLLPSISPYYIPLQNNFHIPTIFSIQMYIITICDVCLHTPFCSRLFYLKSFTSSNCYCVYVCANNYCVWNKKPVDFLILFVHTPHIIGKLCLT